MINNEKLIAELERAVELNTPIVIHSVEEAHQMCEILGSFDAVDTCQDVRQNAMYQRSLNCEVFGYIRPTLRSENGKFAFNHGSSVETMRRCSRATPMDFSEFLRRVGEEPIPLSEYLFEEELCT